jgi:hypothetical protein
VSTRPPLAPLANPQQIIDPGYRPQGQGRGDDRLEKKRNTRCIGDAKVERVTMACQWMVTCDGI